MARIILNKNDEYIGDVGIMQMFRTKKIRRNSWQKNKIICLKLIKKKQILKSVKTKKKANVNNHKSGSQRTKVKI